MVSKALEEALRASPLFGGAYIPEILAAPIDELTDSWHKAVANGFLEELQQELQMYAGRPTPLTEVPRFAARCAPGSRVFLKREDLLHTGAHKLNNALGQCLLAKKMGKARIIAETGAGQHGVATATACARLGLKCIVYMGSIDMQRQAPNVQRMRLLGAEVQGVDTGSATLKDAVNEAMRDWSATFEDSHYCLGSALGPAPFPEMVRVLQSFIGQEAREQILKMTGRLPDTLVACVGGGSNAIGLFEPFLDDVIEMVGVEAGGRGIETKEHAARCQEPKPGVLHGTYTYLLQDAEGQVMPTHSISAGLDYPAIGPEHAALHASGRVHYSYVTDEHALTAMKILSQEEGIIPALESAHALAYVLNQKPEGHILINLSGRGDKDLPSLFAGGHL